MPPPPPFLRWASCRNLVKRSSLNILRCNPTVRSLGYTTCSDVAADSSTDTSSHPVEKLDTFKVINATLDHLKRDRISALFFLHDLKKSGLKHDLKTYKAVVRWLRHCDLDRYALSSNLFNDFTNWKVESSLEISDDHLFEALMEENLIKGVKVLIGVYASLGRFEDAIHAMSEMKRRSGVMMSTTMCNFVLRLIIKECKVDMVESVYRQMKGNGLINPNVDTFWILMEEYCGKGRLKEAWDLFEQMEEAGVEPDAFVYSEYIHGLCAKGKTDLAHQLVKKLRESNNNPPVDVFVYACVIQGFVKESKLEDAKDVLLDMKLRGVVPDRYCYDFLILGYFEKGDIDMALDLCKEMESRGIETLIDHELVEEIKSRKINPLVVMKAPTPTGVQDAVGYVGQLHTTSVDQSQCSS